MVSVSIALATYNGSRFLKRQLESLASQDRLPDELVVCDDASQDETTTILQSFARTAPFPTNVHVNETRQGFRRNFMNAAGYCRSDLVAFCDQDDVWSSRKIGRMLPAFEDPDVMLAYHKVAVVDAGEQRIGTLYAEPRPAVESPARGRPWWNAHGLTQIFRRDLLRHAAEREIALSYEHESVPLAHDQWIMFLSWALGKTRFIDEELVQYRQHEGNAFGHHAPPGLSRRIGFILEDRVPTYRHQAAASRSQAASLLRIAEKEERHLADRARQAAGYLLQLAAFYEERLIACSDPSIVRRASAYRRLTRAGLYRSDGGWSFGAKAQWKDLVLGVMTGRLCASVRPRATLGDQIVARLACDRPWSVPAA